METKILPSLLAADFGDLAGGVRRAVESGADAIHLDIMDPHFVPNISFGPDVVSLSRRIAPSFHRNVHLMMSRPDLYIAKFRDAGADTIQVHVEADCDLHSVLAAIRGAGARNAIALNPETPVERIFPYLGEVDEVLVMTVHPGYGGQKFIDGCLPKMERVRAMRPSLDIMVDGGVNDATGKLCVAAGANMLVAGSWLYRQADMRAGVAALKGAPQ